MKRPVTTISLSSKRLQPGKRGRELEIGAHALRQPFVVDDAVRMVDDAQATDRLSPAS